MLRDVFIPSAGRCGNIGDIVKSFQDIDFRVWLVVPENEASAYRKCYTRTRIVQQTVGRLPQAQELALATAVENSIERMILVDDDFRLFFKTEQDGHLEETNEFFYLATCLNDALKEVPVSGITNRFHHNVKRFPYEEIAPMHTLQAFRVAEIVDAGVRFDRVETYNDTDWLLQCFERGLRNRVWTNFIRGTKESLTGGCSRYRNTELFQRAARQLADLHPGVVKLRDGTRIRRINGQDNEILKMTVFWKKAFKEQP